MEDLSPARIAGASAGPVIRAGKLLLPSPVECMSTRMMRLDGGMGGLMEGLSPARKAGAAICWVWKLLLLISPGELR